MVKAQDKAWKTVYDVEIRHWPETYKIYKIACYQRKQYEWICLLQNSHGCWIVCDNDTSKLSDNLYEVSREGFLEQLKTHTDYNYHIYIDIAAQDNFGTLLDCMVYWLDLDSKLTTF
jgi:hypothetical protein